MNSFLIELAQANIEISLSKLEIFLNSHLIPKFNPLGEYFESLPDWDGKDHIVKLARYLPLKEQALFEYHFKKWLVRCVKCALEEQYFNKQCLVLVQAQQNSGKSTWCRFLCPPELRTYFAEDMSTDKDARIQLARNFLINLDELSVLAKKEINALKAYFSKTMINERLPYDRKNTSLQRICSFVGSTNRTTFLNDETGSVRWLCFDLLGKINFDYFKEIDINDVWAQAYHLAYSEESFDPELSLQDILQNEERNKPYKEPSMEEEFLSKYFEISSDPNEFMTASDIIASLNCINSRLNVISMGKALKSRGFERIKEPKRQVYGYLVRPLFKNSPLELL
ncbi:Virulence-associated protein E [Salinimicrobium catena]|uniref:Virulence-associated protein E n=1 Tax=Salinimicrobium catena TaxID=390640 RepID=A0A1H5I4N0_9FLAO|nr:VapE domain-containing protein [Salinimicrobium catena]SDK74872.1 Virulence-associated protein E [Salinimicrobium catena]SEE35100.1 Virulence-associated protein E [Salinimicrobium catena]